jgi:hypothetical protein
MRAFDAEDFLLAREAAGTHDAAGQALALLARAFPGDEPAALRRLPLGRRNERLLALRETLFGPWMEGYAECPQCGAELELPLDVRAFPPAGPEPSPDALQLDADGWTIRFRLLDSSDLQAACACADVRAARELLIARCVVEARHDGAPVDAAELPRAMVERLAARVEALDPNAETLLDLVCPACKAEWQIALDIASFVHTEVDAEGRRLLHEVHALARGYGWREADILAMSARRRRDYLELLLA